MKRRGSQSPPRSIISDVPRQPVLSKHVDITDPPAARPLRALGRPEVLACLEHSLATGDGLSGAHCIHELWMRGEFASRIETALERLWEHAARTIPDWLPMRYVDWLPTAYEVAARFQAERRGRTNIYLILLDYQDRRGGPHGVYVGMSQYSPAQRFDQHKGGIRAAGSVLKRGLEVLTGPALHLQHIARPLAARIEIELADGLRDAGLLVPGGHCAACRSGIGQRSGYRGGRLAVLTSAYLCLLALPDLLTVDGDVGRSLYSDPDLVAFESQNRDPDARAEPDRFVGTTCENEHERTSSVTASSPWPYSATNPP